MAVSQDAIESKSFGKAEEKILPFRFWWGLLACAIATGAVVAFGSYSDGSLFPPDKGDWWYLWQLKDATIWTRLSAWVPYTIHIVSIWYLIYQAKYAKPRYVFGLHWFNVWALGINGFFVALHIVQTRYFYDGLAQDVHEATSMGSVVLMLFLIMVMENNRRGMFFGKKITFMQGIGDAVKRYHGYYISWAIIYTFWYHPVEVTSGHVAGFAYMFLLLLQSSLFFTRFHVNRWWTMFLETLFVIHGALIAAFILQKGQDQFWVQFLFGGMAVFLITQLHGLNLSTRGKWLVASPVLLTMGIFFFIRPELLPWLGNLPMIMYLGSFLLFLTLLVLRFFGESLQRLTADKASP